MVNLQQQQTGFVPQHNLYTMDVNKGRNCYNCEEFGYIARNCKNREIVEQEKRVDYKDNGKNHNLNEKENLIVLN